MGVGSVLELGAHARVKSFIIYFSRIGYAPYHAKKRKKQLTQNRVRHPKKAAFASDLHLGVDGPQDFGCARAGDLFIFFYLLMSYHTIARKKKWPPTNRVRAQTPTNTSPPARLMPAQHARPSTRNIAFCRPASPTPGPSSSPNQDLSRAAPSRRFPPVTKPS